MYELNKWQKLIVSQPTERQWAFLEKCREPKSEVMFGYGAGAGATTALLLAALDGCETGGYYGLLLRRRYRDMVQSHGIADRLAKALHGQSGASFNKSRMEWTFTGDNGTAHLLLGQIEKPGAACYYIGIELSFLGFDHLQQFDQSDYLTLRSRLRLGDSITAATAVVSRDEKAAWIPSHFAMQSVATMRDNPHLDSEEYKKSLLNLHPEQWRALTYGEWYK